MNLYVQWVLEKYNLLESFVSKLDQAYEEDPSEDELLFKQEALKWAKVQ
jgi:hypothetical protein